MTFHGTTMTKVGCNYDKFGNNYDKNRINYDISRKWFFNFKHIYQNITGLGLTMTKK